MILAMDTKEAAVRWANTWVSAWESHDVDAVVAPITLAGSAFAHFDSEGLLTEVRDYWHETAGHRAPR
jgi:hypothetical protein